MNALRTEFARADDSPGLLLWQVTNRWQAAQRTALAPFDLTHVQFVLLAAVTWLTDTAAGDPVTQRDLAEHAVTDPMMTSQVLRTLEHKKLVERRDHPSDRRAKALRPTEAGTALVNRAITAVEACDRDFFGRLGADAAEFARNLRRLRER
ncbi:MarR family winged helix-turn-helix transcriptional regulator [Nocardia jiangxiensis]|uniref:MarR family winged helix-turn-helix transcriptional regulator n=1 Tax=Nocardia jiangxiensis TaxID=282685 RepID=A0ABW6SD62_9NOCA|nr:MarR family winged helix-turn-helix transcriptional regulator [Nocardia jiangxiensis]